MGCDILMIVSELNFVAWYSTLLATRGKFPLWVSKSPVNNGVQALGNMLSESGDAEQKALR